MIWVSALNKVWADLQSEYTDYICKFSGTLGKIMIFFKAINAIIKFMTLR